MERPESIESALDEALDALVADDAETARRVRARHPEASELTELVEAAARIRAAMATGGPSPQARAKHLQMIREAAARVGRESRAPGRRAWGMRRFVLRPVLALGLLVVLAAPAALALSARAMPGDPLYSTKIAIENVRLAMARDPQTKADLHVEFAQRRVEELARVSGRDTSDAAALAPIVEDLKEHQVGAANAVAAARDEGLPVGPLEERVAVSLQQSTEKLDEVRREVGCATGSDGRCTLIEGAVNRSEQTLRRVDEGPSVVVTSRPGPATPGTPASPSPGEPSPEPTEPSTPPSTEPSPPPSEPPPGGTPGAGSPSQPAAEAFGTVVPPTQVTIDIKPVDTSNSLDIAGRRYVPVVVRGSQDFDPSTLDPSTLCFGDDPTDPANADCAAVEHRLVDINGDGYQDLVVLFRVREAGIDAGDTEACLSGRTTDGRTVKGCDKLTVIAPAATGSPTSPQTGTPNQ